MSKYDKRCRDVELKAILRFFVPSISDLPKLVGYIEISAFENNKIILNEIQMFNLN